MIKVGMVMFQNMRYAPFLNMYKQLLESIDGVSYDIIYYDRDKALKETKDKHHIAIKWHGKGTLSASKFERCLNFVFYTLDVKKVLKSKRYDFLIVLTTFPAVLLSSTLVKKYNNRYIVDVRDYTHEGFKPYYNIEKKVLKNAALRIVSSPGFVNFLPSGHYYCCHNYDSYMIKRPDFSKAKGRPIIISYIGTISYKALCKKLIDLVAKDNRFEFHFYGNEADGTQIRDYIHIINNNRIRFMGPFVPSDKPEIYRRSDLVFNCYGNDSTLVKYAISNKYYDGAVFRKPLLVSPKTSMQDMSGEFAFSLDVKRTVSLNALFDWYQDISVEKYEKYTDTVLKKAQSDNDRIKKIIRKTVCKTIPRR